MEGPAAQTINTTERLAALRSLMSAEENKVDVVVIPSEDQHASEYLASCDERRAFISGFTGSAGMSDMFDSNGSSLTGCISRMRHCNSEGSFVVH
jgi:Xaa-Pro aminopeptidase